MEIRELIQSKLDNLLLQYGILSHHIRREEVDTASDANGNPVEINNNEYVVYRIVTNKNRCYGDGKAKAKQFFVDINYYYIYQNDDTKKHVESRINQIINAFLSDKQTKFTLINGQSDLYDQDNPYRGINVEFSYFGV